MNIFGLSGYLDVAVSTVALVSVVGFTVFFEALTHQLEHRLAGTPFIGMLTKVYKGQYPAAQVQQGSH